MGKQSLTVFVGVQEIGGYYSNLCRGLRKLGVPYRFVTYAPHPFGYDVEADRPLLVRCRHWFYKIASSAALPRIVKRLLFLAGTLFSLPWVLYTCFRYDAFIFGFGQSLLHNQWDLPLLRLLKKRVVFNLAHGSEARPPYLDGACPEAVSGTPADIAELVRQTQIRSRRVQRIEAYASVTIGAIYTSHFFQKKFINIFLLGLPYDGNGDASPPAASAEPDSDERPVRVLHCPSNPVAKGTPLIGATIENLRRKSHAIEFVQIQGRPFYEVLEEIKRSDFVVDQLYSDTPMAGFACEAAWYGKPAVVGGYGLQALHDFIPDAMFPPSMLCQPEQVEAAIETLIVDREKRESLGRQAQAFVRTQWNGEAVAARFLRLISGDIPDSWWVNPCAVAYVEGCCLPKERSRENIRGVVGYHGVGGLGVACRQDIEKALLAFVETEPIIR